SRQTHAYAATREECHRLRRWFRAPVVFALIAAHEMTFVAKPGLTVIACAGVMANLALALSANSTTPEQRQTRQAHQSARVPNDRHLTPPGILRFRFFRPRIRRDRT